jgi:hypothetical protein
LQQLEEQQRFAEQLQQLADPAAAPDSLQAAAADAKALAAIVEGLGSGAGSAAKLAAAAAANPALLIANTWALDGIVAEDAVTSSSALLQERSSLTAAAADAGACAVGAGSAEAAESEAERREAEAAAAVQQYYRQLHEATRQQAALNAQVKGTYGLKAYKGKGGDVCLKQICVSMITVASYRISLLVSRVEP